MNMVEKPTAPQNVRMGLCVKVLDITKQQGSGQEWVRGM